MAKGEIIQILGKRRVEDVGDKKLLTLVELLQWAR